MTLPLWTWCGLFLNQRLILSVELPSPSWCPPDDAHRKSEYFCLEKCSWSCSGELIQVNLIISPAYQSLCAWVSRCLGRWAGFGQPNYCWSSCSPKEAKEGHSPTGIIMNYCIWEQKIWASSSTPGEFYSCCDVWTSPHTSGFVLSCCFGVFDFSAPRPTRCPKEMSLSPAPHLAVTAEGESSCELPSGSLSHSSSNKPALIGQGSVSISLGNLLKALRGNHMKNNGRARQRIAWVGSLFPLYFSSAHLISLVN